MRTYNVFREENRAGGREDWVGEVRAHDDAHARLEAAAQCECPPTCHLRVEPLVPDGESYDD